MGALGVGMALASIAQALAVVGKPNPTIQSWSFAVGRGVFVETFQVVVVHDWPSMADVDANFQKRG